MGVRGLKICKSCGKSFEPQFTDTELMYLWFSDKQIEMDQKHFELTGHSHLRAPTQELCGSCATNPNVESVFNPFTETSSYINKKTLKKLEVKNERLVTAKNGLELVVTGDEEPPPQELVDFIADKLASLSETPKKPKKKWWKFW